MDEEKRIEWEQIDAITAGEWNIVSGLGQIYVSQDDIDYATQLGGNPDVILVDKTAASSRMRQYVIRDFIPMKKTEKSILNQTTPEETFLEPEQKELLRALVQAHRQLPRQERQDFKFHMAQIHNGAKSRAELHKIIDGGRSIRLDNVVITKKEDIPKDIDQDFITHPGFVSGSIDTYLIDIDALKFLNFISFRDDNRFFITPQGLTYYEQLKFDDTKFISSQTPEIQMLTQNSHTPKTFVSYSWDNDAHKEWVRELAVKLREDGVDVTLDRWSIVPGDQLPKFMESSVRENDYVLIICTPNYKKKSNARQGGVGYEGDIITSEIFASQNHRKFIPLLRESEWEAASPSWLNGKYYIDLRGNPYSEEKYRDLLVTLHGQREKAPPIGLPPSMNPISSVEKVTSIDEPPAPSNSNTPIRILGVIVDEISTPRNDGTRGSALYAIPFRLSRNPSAEWKEILSDVWNHPPQFGTMHRQDIARVALLHERITDALI